jgi:LPS-assembly lipoprotein
MKHLIAYLLLVSLTTACGWQLRGSLATHENLKSVYIEAEDTHGALYNELQEVLKSNKIALGESASSASISLFIRDEIHDRRTAAVGSDALTSAYELMLSVHYHVANANGAPMSSLGSAMVTRTFNYNASGASSGAREEALLMSEMRREMAQLLVRRLNALSVNLPPAKQAETHGQAAP